MGYVCPVCETPQADGEHLANHLAFTAMLHGEGHAAWLDEHVSNWADRSPEDLADVVTSSAEETEYDAVFEDTTDDTANQSHPIDDAPVDQSSDGIHDIDDAEVERVIEKARELTRRARSDEDSEE